MITYTLYIYYDHYFIHLCNPPSDLTSLFHMENVIFKMSTKNEEILRWDDNIIFKPTQTISKKMYQYNLVFRRTAAKNLIKRHHAVLSRPKVKLF